MGSASVIAFSVLTVARPGTVAELPLVDMALFVGSALVGLMAFRTYNIHWRFVSLRDLVRICQGISAGAVIYWWISILMHGYTTFYLAFAVVAFVNVLLFVGGSIGSELVRQLIKFGPKKLIALDIDETELYHIENEFGEYPEVIPYVADVTDQNKLEILFNEHRPDIVFHAAAYKHVPMMERHPEEAVRVNVGGTKQMAEVACGYGVDKFPGLHRQGGQPDQRHGGDQADSRTDLYVL
ncbi:MAG: polysaccharide biosynthesis protein [Balneolaceae bacterium]